MGERKGGKREVTVAVTRQKRGSDTRTSNMAARLPSVTAFLILAFLPLAFTSPRTLRPSERVSFKPSTSEK